jgi:hypothetical protein
MRESVWLREREFEKEKWFLSESQKNAPLREIAYFNKAGNASKKQIPISWERNRNKMVQILCKYYQELQSIFP